MTLEEQIAQITNPIEFTKLCNIVFTEKYGQHFQVIDGTRADGGNDGYIIPEKRLLAMYCPIKPERKTDADYLEKISSDMLKAKTLRDTGAYEIENWTFLTPRKLSNDVIVKMRALAKDIGFNSSHQESIFFAVELSKNAHLLKELPSLHISSLEDNVEEILSLLKDKQPLKDLEEHEIDEDLIYRGKPSNQVEMDKVLKIRRDLISENTKSDLKAIYYKSSDSTVRLNALLGLLDFYDPVEDSTEDLVQLCREGIAIAESIDALSAKALILAQKGYLVSFEYSQLDMNTTLQIMADNAIGFQSITESYRDGIVNKLKALELEFEGAFSEALDLAKANQDYKMMASILIFIGNAAGQRAMYLQTLDIKKRATSEKAICRRALLAAKEIYSALGDELNIANALFNLANQIRFFGEETEAMTLVRDTVVVADKFGDSRLKQKSEWLLESLETGEIPDYAAGERRK